MSRVRTPASSSSASLAHRAQATRAQAMLLWSGDQWQEVVGHWTPYHQEATLHEDGHALERAHLASRSALHQQAWSVALGLMPHVRPAEAAATGYRLMKSAADMTWETVVAHRPPDVRPAHLASAIMFEAARHADGATMKAMLSKGAALHDRDENGTTVLSALVNSLSSVPLADLPAAVALFLECVSRLPRERWAPDDVLHVVAKAPTDQVIESLGSPLLPEHLGPAVNQAISYNREPLVKTWLPQVIASAEEERRSKPAKRPATDVLKGAIPLAVAALVDPLLLRWVIDQTRAWCPRASWAQAFNQAADGKRWPELEMLWPQVRLEDVWSRTMGKATTTGDHDVQDWVFSRLSPDQRENLLPQGRRAREATLAELPLTRARMESEQRETQAATLAPTKGAVRRFRS